MPKQMIFVPTATLSKQTVRLALRELEFLRKEVAFKALAWEKHRSGSPKIVEKKEKIATAIDELKTYLQEL